MVYLAGLIAIFALLYLYREAARTGASERADAGPTEGQATPRPTVVVKNINIDALEPIYKEVRQNILQGNGDQAITILSDKIAKETDREMRQVLQALRGDTLLELDRFEEASKQYDELIDQNPSNPTFHFRKGQILKQRIEGMEPAIAEFKKSLELGFTDPMALYYIAFCYKTLGDFPKVDTPQNRLDSWTQALSFYKRAAETSSKNPELAIASLNGIADIYYNMGRQEEALSIYKDVLSRQQQKDPRILVYISHIYIDRQEPLTALEHLEQAQKAMAATGNQADKTRRIVLAEVAVDLRFSKAQAYLRLGKLREAEVEFDEVLDLTEPYGEQLSSGMQRFRDLSQKWKRERN